MPLDALCVHALARELNETLAGAKIDKIQQPERDLFLFTLRSQGSNPRLLIGAGSGMARAHLTEEKFENPAQPPMLCMLLRKHLMGARILSVTAPDFERMLIFDLDTRDELEVHSGARLVLEMMGRSANLILVGEDGRIVDCLRRVDMEMNSQRQVLPGLIFRLPPKNKPGFFALSSAERRALWAGAEPARKADDWLLDSFSGLSPVLCRELCVRAFGETSPIIETLPAARRDNLPAAMDALEDTVRNGELQPLLLVREGRPADITCLPLHQYGPETEQQPCESFSALLETYYTQRGKEESARRRAQTLNKTVKSIRDRTQRRLAQQQEELLRSEDRESLRRSGDLITANLYRMKKGDRVLRTEDFYREDCPVVEVGLDARKTPQENAAAFYKAYKKACTAEKHLKEQIALGQKSLDYLNSVLEEIARAEGERDLAEIRRELTETGYIREKRQTKGPKTAPVKPLRFLSDGGLEILVGRSNLQNDTLTLKTARRTDWWLHTREVHGAHVIIVCGGQDPDAETVAQAASLAVYYSQGRRGGKTAVDCTQVRCVRKPAGALPGKVIYTDYTTLYARADEELVKRLEKKG